MKKSFIATGMCFIFLNVSLYEVSAVLPIGNQGTLVTPQKFDQVAQYIYDQHKAWNVTSLWATDMHAAYQRETGKLNEKNLRAFFVQDEQHHFTQYGEFRKEDRDALALCYSGCSDDVCLILKFTGKKHKETGELENFISPYGTILYKKKVRLFSQGIFNLLRILYEDEQLIGSYEDGFAAAKALTHDIIKDKRMISVKAYLVECDNASKANELADAVQQFRVKDGLVYSSWIYGTTRSLAQSIFNDNSIHFLNYAHLCKLEQFDTLIELYKQMITEQNMDSQFFCVEGDAVLAVYGIRDCHTLNFLSHGDNHIMSSCVPGLCNNTYDSYKYVLADDDLIFNPSYYFYHKGLKFLSLDEVLKAKIARSNERDKFDVIMTDAFLKSTVLNCCQAYAARLAENPHHTLQQSS